MALILSGTNGLSDVDGTAATPAIRGTDANTGMFFPAADTIAFAEGGVEAMRLDSAGNVGIGTNSPTQKLDVSGPIKSSGFFVGLTGTSGFAALGTTGTVTDGGNFVGRSATSTFNAGGVEIYTGGAERMRIDSSGNLLVGTMSGSQKLRVQGGQTQDAAWFVTTHTVGSQYAAVSIQRSASTGDMIQFWNQAANAVIGTVSTNNTSVAYNTSSDYRLKNTIAPMTGALAKVAALKPVTYKWNSDGSDGQGFIAHELAEVCPDAVSGAKDAVDPNGKPVYQGIDTSFLVATLTAAMQEQQKIIESLTARVAQLEAK